jgi:hypothetical protein
MEAGDMCAIWPVLWPVFAPLSLSLLRLGLADAQGHGAGISSLTGDWAQIGVGSFVSVS